jgi:hypothetical protein
VEFPESVAWRPDDPTTDGNHDNPIEGVLTHAEMFTGGQYADYPILHLELPNGTTVAVHAFRTLLRNKVIELAPKYGETLRIAWGGEKQGKNGGPNYHDYRVMVVGREGGSFDWGRIGGGPDEMQRTVYEQPEAAIAAGPSDDGIPY